MCVPSLPPCSSDPHSSFNASLSLSTFLITLFDLCFCLRHLVIPQSIHPRSSLAVYLST